jgi:hypothetical protein
MPRSTNCVRQFVASEWSQHGPSGINPAIATAGKEAFGDANMQIIAVVGCPISVGRVGPEPTTQGL